MPKPKLKPKQNSKKKGLSLEEKIVRVEQFIIDRAVPMTLKELEAAVPKATGVIYQSVQECLEVLVAENRVHTDKLGVSTFYWRFVATEPTARWAAQQLLAAEAEEIRVGNDRLRDEIAAIRAEKQMDDPEYEALAASVQAQEDAAAEEQRAMAERCTAAEAVAARDAMIALFHAANRSTDNVIALEAAARDTLGIPAREFRRRFGIPDDLDFVEPLEFRRDGAEAPPT